MMDAMHPTKKIREVKIKMTDSKKGAKTVPGFKQAGKQASKQASSESKREASNARRQPVAGREF